MSTGSSGSLVVASSSPTWPVPVNDPLRRSCRLEAKSIDRSRGVGSNAPGLITSSNAPSPSRSNVFVQSRRLASAGIGALALL